MRTLGLATALAGLMWSMGSAQAVTCPVSSPNTVLFSATSNVGITCGGIGNGEGVNGIGGDEPASPTLDSAPGTGFLADGILSITGFGSSSGTWTITPGPGMILTNLVIAFQGTVEQTNPDWAWFNLDDGSTTGTWTIASSNGKTLTEAYLYGSLAVPLPAAFPLLGAALAGLGGLGWLRRRRETVA